MDQALLSQKLWGWIFKPFRRRSFWGCCISSWFGWDCLKTGNFQPDTVLVLLSRLKFSLRADGQAHWLCSSLCMTTSFQDCSETNSCQAQGISNSYSCCETFPIFGKCFLLLKSDWRQQNSYDGRHWEMGYWDGWIWIFDPSRESFLCLR